MTFLESAETWIASRASKDTRTAYSSDMKLWLAHCKEARTKPDKPPRAVVVSFRDELQRTRAPLTVRRILASLSALYAAVRPGNANPFAERALPRPPASNYSRTEAISGEDARMVIAAAAEHGESPLRDVALLMLLYATGMRRSSAVSIRRDGIIKRGAGYIVRHVVKGGEEKEKELAAEAGRAISAWLESAPFSRWLFCTLDGSRPISPQVVTKIVARASAAVGLHVHPHQFRATAATDLFDAGEHIERVRAFLDHKDIRSTLRYDARERGAGVAAKLAEFRAGKPNDRTAPDES